MEKRDYEFSEEELMNVQGGFPHMLDNEHPFNEEELYGKTQKEKLQALKEELEQYGNSPVRRSGR